MDIRKYKMTSKFDGLRLDVEEVIPDRIKGIVQISHGMAEHKERYEDFMKFLAEHDYMTVIHDHRGHGNSVNDLVELGNYRRSSSDHQRYQGTVPGTSNLFI